MPIFRFNCQKCGDNFELLLKNSQEKAVCPKCGSTRLKKELNRVGAIKSGGVACGHADSCPHAEQHVCNGHCCCGH